MITYSLYSDIGNREKNEDSIAEFHRDGRYVFAVADGLGGHGKGEVASAMAMESARKIFENKGIQDTDILSDIFENAQTEILGAQEHDRSNGMKTTLVVLDVCAGQIRWAHIGDSRLYYFHNNKLKERTLDHSVPQMLVLAHKLKEKNIRGHEDRNKLLRVLGSPWESKKYECREAIFLEEKQAFLLCTDGFWELIDEKTMTKLLKKAKTVDEWMASMSEVVKANGRDVNMDNNSAIAVWSCM